MIETDSEILTERLNRLRFLIEAEVDRVRELVGKNKSQSMDSEDFDLRGGLYKLAFEVAPEARNEDLLSMKKWIAPREGELSVDVAAGTGFLTIPLASWTDTRVYAIDPSVVQLENLNRKKGEADIVTIVGSLSEKTTMDAIGKSVGKIDLVTSYGGIHHVVDEDGINKQRSLFENVAAILKPGGRAVMGDVGAGTKLAEHFEQSVKRYCLTGHYEKWLSPERLKGELTEDTGLRLVKYKTNPIKWKFDNEKQMALFMKCLHAYDMSESEILADLRRILGYRVKRDGFCELNWPMLFFELRKG
jgi:SAM-dependent methyltransferase